MYNEPGERGDITRPVIILSLSHLPSLKKVSAVLGTGQPGWQFSLIQIVIMVPANADTAPSSI